MGDNSGHIWVIPQIATGSGRSSGTRNSLRSAATLTRKDIGSVRGDQLGETWANF